MKLKIAHLQKQDPIKNNPYLLFNIKVFKELKTFCVDDFTLIASLLQIPFKKNNNLDYLVNLYPKEVIEILLSLNQIITFNKIVLGMSEDEGKRQAALIFVTNYKFLLNKKNNNHNQTKNFFTKTKLKFVLDLLKSIDVGYLKSELEDKIFKLLSPKKYLQYSSLIRLTKKQRLEQEREIKNKIKNILNSVTINFKVETRIKSLYSIDKKIGEKNFLLSQILDNIGLRIITNTTAECYIAMEAVLKEFTVLQG